MQRRSFLRVVAATGGAGAGLASLAGKGVKETSSVEWTVKGFYCKACAIGLETLLQRQEGIMRATAEYPSGRVRIGFDGRKIKLAEISRLIEETGFRVAG